MKATGWFGDSTQRSDALCWSIICKRDSPLIKMYLLDGHIFMTHFLTFMVAYNTLFLYTLLSFFNEMKNYIEIYCH